VNAKTASDLRSYGAAVVSDGRESRTGHVVNCTTQVELHQIYFNIKPESPGTTCSLLPLLLTREVLTRVSVVLQQWIFWSMGDTSSRRLSTPPLWAFPSISQNCFDLESFDIITKHYLLNYILYCINVWPVSYCRCFEHYLLYILRINSFSFRTKQIYRDNDNM